MRVLQFTIPVPINQTIIVQKESLPYFYPHLHRHHEIQLTWIQKGKGTISAENNMHSFAANQIYRLGTNQPHLFKSDPAYFLPKSKKLSTALTIFFNPNGSLSHLFELPELKNINKLIQQHPSGFKLPQALVAEISSQMLRLQDGNGVEQLISLLDILKKLAGYKNLIPLAASAKPRQYSEHEGLKFGSICSYIIQHYNKSITLEEVAGQSHMTPQAFCRCFKKLTRHTFISSLNEVRINKACKKLTDGDYKSTSGVAYNCGCNGATSFNRVFKPVASYSPSEYLSNFLKNVE